MTVLPGVGIFGTGVQTKILVPRLKKEGFRVEALWGLTREEAEVAAKELGIPYATNRIDDVLLRKDVDLLLVLCPPAHHSQIAVKALGIGKHVAVQCPGGLSQDESLRMVQAAQYYPRLISTLNLGLRFHPAFVKMRAALREARKGAKVATSASLIGPAITYCDVRIDSDSLVGDRYGWQCDDAMGGGVLNLFGAHAIDLLAWLTGQRAVRAHGVVRTFRPKTDKINGIRQISADDVCNFQLELSGGGFATVAINSHRSAFSQEILVSGDDGHLVARNGNLFGRRNGEKEETVLHLDSKGSDHSDHPLLPGIYLDGLGNMFAHLAKQFSSGSAGNGEVQQQQQQGLPESDFASLEDAQYVQAVIEAVRRSSREKAWTKVTHLEWWK